MSQQIKAVILVASRDFNRCPLASRLPTALWPVVGKPVVERLLSHLAEEGIKQAVVCSSGEGSLLADSIHPDSRLQVTFHDELLPLGTAGSLRCAAEDGSESLLLVFPASTVCPPKIDVLLDAHRQGQSDLTVMLNPSCTDGLSGGQASGIYVCNPSVLRHIPKAGYFDIKEGLIPEMLSAGESVHAARLPEHASSFRDRRGYQLAVANYLADARRLDADTAYRKDTAAGDVWVAKHAEVEPRARLCGPVVVMKGARISSGAVLLGPTVVQSDAVVGKDSIIVSSMLWDGSRVGSDCQIRQSVVDAHAVVRSRTVVENKSVVFRPAGLLGRSVERLEPVLKNVTTRVLDRIRPQLDGLEAKLPAWVYSDRKVLLTFLASSVVLLAFFWSYHSGLTDLWNLWMGSDEYSAGLLVPFLAIYVLWSRRDLLARCPIRPSIWGLFAFVGAQAVRLFGLFFMYSSAERISIVLSIAAIILLLFGWQVFRKVSTTLLFLCLILPWPSILQYHVGLHLQHWATSSAVFCLETVGYQVIQEGNIIHIGDTSVEVAYACNGLRMITAFFVISGLVVLLVDRTWWEKLIILVSSIPVALLCNTGRLTVTAVALTKLNGQFWDDVFHDFGGYAMMPLAIAAIVGELWLLTKLTAVPQTKERIIIARQRG